MNPERNGGPHPRALVASLIAALLFFIAHERDANA
jgi:hypothetical protein